MPALSEAHRKKLRKVFDELDTDGSDDLDYEELKAALTQMKVKMSLKELKQIWIDADKDADSGISFDEFVAAVEKLPMTLHDRKESMEALQTEISEVKKKKKGKGKKKEAEEEEQQQCRLM